MRYRSDSLGVNIDRRRRRWRCRSCCCCCWFHLARIDGRLHRCTATSFDISPSFNLPWKRTRVDLLSQWLPGMELFFFLLPFPVSRRLYPHRLALDDLYSLLYLFFFSKSFIPILFFIFFGLIFFFIFLLSSSSSSLLLLLLLLQAILYSYSLDLDLIRSDLD